MYWNYEQVLIPLHFIKQMMSSVPLKPSIPFQNSQCYPLGSLYDMNSMILVQVMSNALYCQNLVSSQFWNVQPKAPFYPGLNHPLKPPISFQNSKFDPLENLYDMNSIILVQVRPYIARIWYQVHFETFSPKHPFSLGLTIWQTANSQICPCSDQLISYDIDYHLRLKFSLVIP